MGHAVNRDRPYHRLQQRLDRHLTGAPESPTFMKILALLFSPEEAGLAARIPGRPTPLKALSDKLGIPRDDLGAKLAELAERGLIVDLEHDGQRYFALPPVVIGFFEFTFMRARDNLPMADLARLFHQYMTEDDFYRSVFAGKTQLGRSLVHEEALADGDYTEVLDWERASHVVQTASAVGVSQCVCRHEASHLGEVCDRPQRCCMSLNYVGDLLIRSGNAEPITTAEAMHILQQCKEAGLAQTGDNVQRKVTYICNCCGCCCLMVRAIRQCGLRGAIATSNWIMEVDSARCKGCGACAEACPVEAIELVGRSDADEKHKLAVRDEGLCLGCGVCYSACNTDAIRMRPRPQRVFTPETIFDRMVLMAVERGKLGELIFDDPERLSHRALGRILGILERSPPFKAAMAVKPLRSAFLRTVVAGAKRASGRLAELLE